MAAAAVVVVMMVMVHLTLGTAAEKLNEETIRRTRYSGKLFAPPGTLAASLLQPDPVKIKLNPDLPSVPIPPLKRFRRSKELLQAAQTIEDMVKMMDDKEDSESPDNPLKTELLLLSHEIHSTLTPPSDGDENSTSVTFIHETPGPFLNNPKGTLAPIVNDPKDTSGPVFNNPDQVPEVAATDAEDAATARALLRRVKEILESSGIELVLPIDCGRNPLQPNDQLGTSKLPWLVALGSREDGRFFYRCPGLIVTNFHVLTDADCTASPNINVVHVSRSGQVPDEEGEENFVVGRRIHPDIKTLTDLFNGINVGILELAKPFIFHNAVQPVCLPGLLDEPDPFTTFNGVAAGYSVLPNTASSQAGRVAEVYVKNATVYGPAWCRSGALNIDADPNVTLSLQQVINEKHVCASLDFDEIGKSVLLAEDERTGRVRVVGVGSFANAEDTYPVAYTLMQPHRFWVEITLKRFLDNTASRVTLEDTGDERQ